MNDVQINCHAINRSPHSSENRGKPALIYGVCGGGGWVEGCVDLEVVLEISYRYIEEANI